MDFGVRTLIAPFSTKEKTVRLLPLWRGEEIRTVICTQHPLRTKTLRHKQIQIAGNLERALNHKSFNKTNRTPLWDALLFWRRRRDSNSRTAFDGYTISNRARSTSYATSPYMFGFKLNILLTTKI